MNQMSLWNTTSSSKEPTTRIPPISGSCAKVPNFIAHSPSFKMSRMPASRDSTAEKFVPAAWCITWLPAFFNQGPERDPLLEVAALQCMKPMGCRAIDPWDHWPLAPMACRISDPSPQHVGAQHVMRWMSRWKSSTAWHNTWEHLITVIFRFSCLQSYGYTMSWLHKMCMISRLCHRHPW